MASIHCRNGIFYLIALEKGRQRWRSLHTRDKTEAERLKAEYERLRERAVNPKISDLAGKCQELLAAELSAKTLGMYQTALDTLSRLIGDKRLVKLTRLDVDRFKVLRLREITATSVGVELRTLRAAFGRAQEWGMIEVNPFKGCRMPKTLRKEPAYVAESDLNRLIARVEDGWFKDLIIVTFYSMLRLGEVTHLKWEHVDLTRGFLTVKSEDGFRVKCDRPRQVPIHPRVREVLLRWHRSTGLVFAKPNGWPYLASSLSKKFKQCARAAGLPPGVHFHSLRHGGVSYYMQRGLAPDLVRRMAGHSTMLMTEHYTHYDTEHFRNAMRQFELAGSAVMN